MDVFHSLSFKTRLIIVSSGLTLLLAAFGVLVFGDNVITEANMLIEHTKDAARADLLYVHPEEAVKANEVGVEHE